MINVLLTFECCEFLSTFCSFLCISVHPNPSFLSLYVYVLLSLFQTVLNPVQNGAELILDNISQLKTLINRYRSDRQNTSPLTMKLNGTLDAAVSGGVANFDVSTCIIETVEYLGGKGIECVTNIFFF